MIAERREPTLAQLEAETLSPGQAEARLAAASLVNFIAGQRMVVYQVLDGPAVGEFGSVDYTKVQGRWRYNRAADPNDRRAFHDWYDYFAATSEVHNVLNGGNSVLTSEPSC